jgi:hypothetical protein
MILSRPEVLHPRTHSALLASVCILGGWLSPNPAAADLLEPAAPCAIEATRDRLSEVRRRLEVAEDELAKYPLIPSAAVIPAATLATFGVLLHALTVSDRDAPLAYGLTAIPATAMLAGLGVFIARSRQAAPFARERAPLLKLEARYDRELREAAHGKCGPPLTQQELRAAIAESERELEQLELRADATRVRKLKTAVAALSVATGGWLARLPTVGTKISLSVGKDASPSELFRQNDQRGIAQIHG